MSKKRRIGLFDLGSLPITRVKREENYDRTLGDYNRRIAEQEKQAAARVEQERLEQAERARIAELNSPASIRVKKYWSQPLQEIQTNGVELSPVDIYGDYATTPRDAVAEDTASDTFLADLTSQGCSLCRSGFQKLSAYLESLAYHRGVSLSVTSSWHSALARLHSLSVFEPHELEGYPPATKKVKQSEEPRRATMDDLLNIDESTRAGRREAQRISEELYFIERQPMVRAWFASLAKNFGIEVTHADAERCKSWFERNNKSFLNPHHFNECRLWNARAGYWPDALTSVERVNDEIERADLTRMTFDERRILSNKKRAAQEEDRAKFGHSQ